VEATVRICRVPRASSATTRPCRAEDAASTQPWPAAPVSDRPYWTGAMTHLEGLPVGVSR
jgi:hypothetical protein